MEGRFGKWAWVANGVLFGAYHWHQPWGIPSAIIAGILIFSLASYRYKSTWMSILLHSVQSVIFTFLVFGVVMGIAQSRKKKAYYVRNTAHVQRLTLIITFQLRFSTVVRGMALLFLKSHHKHRHTLFSLMVMGTYHIIWDHPALAMKQELKNSQEYKMYW